MKGVFVKDLRSLRPADPLAEEIMRSLKAGAMVTVEVRKSRNLQHHRLYWSLMQLVADNMDGNYSAEVVSDVVKIRAGHVIPVRTAKGEVFLPKSISFAAMDQQDFREFFDRAIQVVTSDILPGLDSETLRREVYEMIGTTPAALSSNAGQTA